MLTNEMLIKAAEIPQMIKQEKPLIHMIPNQVSAAFCADMLSAIGARPLMAVAEQEMTDIVGQADGLVVNLGQPDDVKYRICRKAILIAKERQIPIVIDPVGAGASFYRCRHTRELLDISFDGIIKGNTSEMEAVRTGIPTFSGVDGIDSFQIQKPEKGRCYGITGSSDYILNEKVMLTIKHQGKTPWKVTGMGCAIGAILGACYSVCREEETVLLAAFGMAGWMQSSITKTGYGSYKQALLDGFSTLWQEKEALYTYLKENTASC